MKFIDIHNHILPDIDDGPKNMNTIIEMLNCASDQGIEEVLTTVHYLHPMMDNKKGAYDLIDDRFNSVKKKIIENKINIKLHVGTEVFFMPNLIEYINKKYVTMGNGKYILIEFPVNNIPDIHKEVFFDLKMRKIVPIIAHPERYRQVQENVEILYEWLERGWLIQVDAGSILKLSLQFIFSSFKVTNPKLCYH